ncbi:MAG TPA: TIM barrel protein [Candidatus Hydrogenedentes bacterium]|nr:TIM barrel protein [Candidatus Hydrogenedentota bacterium]
MAVEKRNFQISLAGWSLHRSIGEGEGKIPMLDMPKLARQEFGIGAIELVNQMLPASDAAYLDKLARNAADNDVKILLTMVDGEGAIGDLDADKRADAVVRHQKWIDVTEYLGGHTIRMNWVGAANDVASRPAELKAFIDRCVPEFRKLCDYGDSKNINVVIENHGGASSEPGALIQLMVAVDHPRFGTLPDFGNFPDHVDKYLATDLMMNFAKAVSAKCHDFDDETGLETTMDYERLIAIVVDQHGYHGHIGIEFEGGRLSEFEGIKACKKLLETLQG